jgi:hypothetical protein
MASSLMVLLLVGGIQLVHGISGGGVAPGLALAAPLLLVWMFSPLIAEWINQPIALRSTTLTEEQAGLFRQVARRTWGFFERFVGPEDHWLPPDQRWPPTTWVTWIISGWQPVCKQRWSRWTNLNAFAGTS